MDSYFTIAIEWTMKNYQRYFDAQRNLSVRLHPSVKENRSISVNSCLDLFSMEEQLSENDTWFCPKCKKHTRAKKKMEIYKTPQILIIQFKRFSASRWGRIKVDTQINFPVDGLDLTNYLCPSSPQTSQKEENIYDLCAVINHGGSLYGGHYTAFAKNFCNYKWYLFNDDSVSPFDEKEIVSQKAYVCFYMKRKKN